jgi:hypothetical protein
MGGWGLVGGLVGAWGGRGGQPKAGGPPRSGLKRYDRKRVINFEVIQGNRL